MQSRFRLILVMALVAAFGPNMSSAAQDPAPQVSPQPQVTATSGGLTLSWEAPPAVFRVNAFGETEISIPGYRSLNQPGVAQVPFASALIALPRGAAPELEILSTVEQVLDLPAPLGLAPIPQGVVRDSLGEIVGGGFIEAQGEADFPYAAVKLEQVGIVRGVQLARVDFYPARPEAGKLHMTTQIQVGVRFNATESSGTRSDASIRDPLLERVQASVVNPDAVRAPSRSTFSSSGVSGAEALNVAVVEVEQTGVVAITYADLQNIGFALSGVNPVNLHLTRDGTAIAYQWDGDGDAVFEPGERLLFYADPRFSRYTSSDAYFLSAESSAGLRMDTRSASPTGLPDATPVVDSTVELNDIYTPGCYCAPIPAGRDGDRWVWDRLQIPDRPSVDFPFELPDVDPTKEATLNLWLIGYTDVAANPDHQVDVILNGDTANKLGTIVWDGKQAIAESLAISPNKLQTGSNTLTLTLPGIGGVSVEGTWLDAFQVEYARSSAPLGNTVDFIGVTTQHAYTVALANNSGLRAFEITDPDVPLVLTDLNVSGSVELGDPVAGGIRRYWVTNEAGITAPSGLRLMSNPPAYGGADYVIVTPGEFEPALAPLIELRENQGYQVAVADLQAVYDHFGGGRAEPEAIYEYLSQAYQTWDPPPIYVLLVGDGTSDPKRYQPVSAATILPPFLADVDPWAGETAADNRFVTVDGADNLPDMLIGRLPVNTINEVQTVVGKIVAYESAPPTGGWNQLLAFVADDPDDGGNFPAQTETVIETFVAPAFGAERLLYTPPAVNADEIRDQLLEDWQAGLGLVMFTGHASVHQWAVEKFLHYDDVSQLNNGDRLPVVVEMTCFTGSFQIPSISSLDEALVRQPAGGAVASWGATGLGISTGHEALTEGFMELIFHTEQKDLGTAALEGKLKVLEKTPVFLDLVDTFTLLGDPATRINLPTWTDTLFVPLIQH